MKRICLLGAAIAAVLILGVATALAASSPRLEGKGKKTRRPPPATTKVSCTSSPCDPGCRQAPPTSPPPPSRTRDGATSTCPGIGHGVVSESYTTADSGDLSGKWQTWFNTGSVFGTFTLTPDDNAPPTTTTSFSAASYTGTFIIKNGTGADAKATGKGTLKCATQDSVHFGCKQAGKVILPAPAPARARRADQRRRRRAGTRRRAVPQSREPRPYSSL